MTVMSPEDTGELRNLAEQLHRLDHDPRQAGLIDVIMLTVIIAASLVVTICWVSLVMAPDHYPVDIGRVMLTSASAASIIAAVFAGLFGVTRAHRRRHEQLMDMIKRTRCDCPGTSVEDAKTVAMRSFETGRRIGRRESGDG